MKLQIAFDLTNLEQALEICSTIEHQADIIEVGSLLIYKYGEEAVKKFKEKFSNKIILADAKIADQGKEAIRLFAAAGADWITVLSGAGKDLIHACSTTAHEAGKKVMLDLIDATSLGQAALEAKSLGADALLFHTHSKEDEQLLFADRWEMVKGNTQLPIFITTNITRENMNEILSINASGVVIGKAIVGAANPQEEANYFSNLLKYSS